VLELGGEDAGVILVGARGFEGDEGGDPGVDAPEGESDGFLALREGAVFVIASFETEDADARGGEREEDEE
jgi:hypothetical protein